MSKIEIEINDDNDMNRGWLLYLLGKDQPSAEDDPQAHDGWDMAENTGQLRNVRGVFLPLTDPDAGVGPYTVRMVSERQRGRMAAVLATPAVPDEPKRLVVTSVEPDGSLRGEEVAPGE